MIKNITTLVISIFFLSLTSSPSSAHTGHKHTTEKYTVETVQEPLSPFVGEKVRVTFTVTDTAGQPVSSLAGNLVMKRESVKQYTNNTSEQASNTIFQQAGTTDNGGVVSLEYTFKDEGLYDAEFIWGSGTEDESAGLQIFAREPSSYFLPQELMKRIWLFIGIAFVGIIVGAAGSFILLTAKLHKRE